MFFGEQCPREGKFSIDNEGFLIKPYKGFFSKSNIVEFDDINSIPCLILIGEPGIGKSTDIKDNFDKIHNDENKKFIDLNSIESDSAFDKDIFESTWFKDWTSKDYQLELFLDSFDECLIKFNTLSRHLEKRLENNKANIQRLKLRIVCRTAFWPSFLEEALKELFGESNFKVYELVPLTREDVINAAKYENLDHKKFINEIREKEVSPFAIKPLTLKFLINIYINEKTIPNENKYDFFLNGCKYICYEHNPSIRDSALNRRNYSQDELLAVAGRIAYLTIFSNKFTVWIGGEYDKDINQNDIKLSQLNIKINENINKETLSTGLFSSQGYNRLGWSHKSYAEFLAAWYLFENNIKYKQILNFIVNSKEKKVIPQLYETAAWLASLYPEIKKYIIENDPFVSLLCDENKLQKNDKKEILKSLLKEFEDQKRLEIDRYYEKYLKKLKYNGIEKEIKKYLNDKSQNNYIRRFVIEVAENCKLKSLQKDLIKIALDEKEDINVRKYAAEAIYYYGDDKYKLKLKPLAKKDNENDPDDELKGYALKSNWPENINIDELLEIITHPKRDNYLGSYKYFIQYEFPEKLNSSNINKAMSWVENQDLENGPYYLSVVAEEMIKKSFEFFDKPEVVEETAQIILKYIRTRPIKENRLFVDKLKDVSTRHKIIEAIIPIMNDSDLCINSDSDLIKEYSIIETSDFEFLIEKLKSDNNNQKKIALLLRKIFDPEKVNQIESLFELYQSNEIFKDIFKDYFQTIELNSQEAKHYCAVHELKNYNNKNYQLEIDRTNELNNIIDNFNDGNIKLWSTIHKEIVLNLINKNKINLTKTFYWEKTDDNYKKRIIDSAKEFILSVSYSQNNSTKIHAALILLIQEEPDFINSISQQSWINLVPAILDNIYNNEDFELHNNLFKLAYNKAGDIVIENFVNLFNKNEILDYLIYKIALLCWDNKLKDVFLELLKENDLTPGKFEKILTPLLENKVFEAEKFAKEIIYSYFNDNNKYQNNDDKNRYNKVVISTANLLSYSQDGGWNKVWPVLQKKNEFTHDVIKKLANMFYFPRRQFGIQLSEDKLKDFYLLIEELYPRKNDPKYIGAHAVSERDKIAELRDDILQNLKERGTIEAVKVIEEIKQKSEYEFIKWWHNEAFYNYIIKSWKTYSPKELLEIIKNNESRLINNEDDLLEVIIESLNRLQKNLIAAENQFLWNDKKPKDESSISDYIKIHLEKDVLKRKIIVNREVQINKKDKTDIRIDAILNNDKQLTVIIEVKGCWNNGLETSMENQLVQKYLKHSSCKHGIYLVVWFLCDKWDDGDYRKGSVKKFTLEKLKDMLCEQAEKLSSENYINVKPFVLDVRFFHPAKIKKQLINTNKESF